MAKLKPLIDAEGQVRDISLKKFIALMLALMAPVVFAKRDDTPINSASELRDWCKTESEASLIGSGLTPFNWTARYWDDGNVLMVKGQWRVDTSNVTVDCSVARGARSRDATMSVHEPE